MYSTISKYLLLYSLCISIREVFPTTQVCDDHQGKSSKSKYSILKNAVESIRQSCGEICDTGDSKSTKDHEHFLTRTKKINCRALFEESSIERMSEFSYPPQKIPKYLLKDFLYGERVELRDFYLDYDINGKNHALDWNIPLWELYSKLYDENKLPGAYGFETTNEIKRFLQPDIADIRGHHVLIIGSQSPWLEILVLKAGAKHVTTMDYVQINNKNPNVSTITPNSLKEKFLSENITFFDSVISHSSLEHSGLGRYSDALNPWGDLITMAKAWCVVKPLGLALIGVPAGIDRIEFNAHRIYGPLMFSHLFTNWKLKYSELNYSKFNENACSYCYQPVQLFEKMTME